MDNNKEPIEVNLNLSNDLQNELGFGDIIRFLWNGRKVLLICIFVGLIVSLSAAGVYYVKNKPVINGGSAAATIKLLYPEAVDNLTPHNVPIDHAMLLSSEVIDPAIAAISIADFTVSDLRKGISYANLGLNEKVADYTQLNITFNTSDNLVNEKATMEVILNSVITSYISYFNQAYKMQDVIDIELAKAVLEWESYFEPIINWDKLEYNESFVQIAEILESLLPYISFQYTEDPTFIYNGITFKDLYDDTRLLNEDAVYWASETTKNPYYKDIDGFIAKIPSQITALKNERDKLNRLLDQYTALLSSLNLNYMANNESGNMKEISNVFELIDDIYNYDNKIAQLEVLFDKAVNGQNENIATVDADLDNMLKKLAYIQQTGREMCKASNEYYLNRAYAHKELIVMTNAPAYKAVYTGGISIKTVGFMVTGLFFISFMVGVVIIIGKRHV